MSTRRSLTGGLALVLAFSWSARARAQSSSDGIAAQALFDEARQLMASGKYHEACPKLEESQRLDPGSGTLLNLADCYEHDGRIASAWNRFLESASSARGAGKPDREKVARDRAAALAPKLAKIAITVAANHTEGLEIRRDGELIGQAQWNVGIPADPGEHVVSASAPGRKPWQSKIKLESHAMTATVTVPELEGAGEKSPAASAPAPTSEPAAAVATTPSDAPVVTDAGPSGGSTKTAGLVVMGAGIVGAGVGSVFGLRAFSYKDQRDKHCTPQGCDPAGIGYDTDGRAAATVSTVCVGLGLAAIGAGAVLYLQSSKTTAQPSAWVAPTGAPHGAGVALGGTW